MFFFIVSHPLFTFATLTFLALLYLTSLIIYRLYFHPLAKFPGPKLAAATKWYEFYFDIVKGVGGQFAWEIDRMHEVYGPIVRINNDELHVKDSNFYPILYAKNPTIRDKWTPAANMLGSNLSSFGTVSHELHRKRRLANSPFYSKSSIAGAEPVFHKQVERLCNILRCHLQNSEVVDTGISFLAYATDILCENAFAGTPGYQDNEEMAKGWYKTTEAAARLTPLVKQFPWLIKIAMSLPVNFVDTLNPVLARSLKLHHFMIKQATRFVAGELDGETIDMKHDRPLTIFHSIQDSSLPAHDKTIARLAHEGFTLIIAGSEGSGRALCLAFYYLLANPQDLARLMEELREAIPDPNILPSMKKLQELPWLSAVIKETLRVSAIVTSRLPLTSRSQLMYRDWTIPAGVPVGMTPRDVLLDPSIFQDPHTYSPQRWIKLANEGINLDRFFVAFGKGTRMCQGMEIANTILYFTIATLFRRFEFELYDLVPNRDIEPVRDCFIGEPSRDSKGVRIKVLKELE